MSANALSPLRQATQRPVSGSREEAPQPRSAVSGIPVKGHVRSVIEVQRRIEYDSWGLLPGVSNAPQASTCFCCYSYASEINSMEK